MRLGRRRARSLSQRGAPSKDKKDSRQQAADKTKSRAKSKDAKAPEPEEKNTKRQSKRRRTRGEKKPDSAAPTAQEKKKQADEKAAAPSQTDGGK